MEQKKGTPLSVEISITDTSVFKRLVDVVREMATDKRIAQDIRNELVDKVLDIVEEGVVQQ